MEMGLRTTIKLSKNRAHRQNEERRNVYSHGKQQPGVSNAAVRRLVPAGRSRALPLRASEGRQTSPPGGAVIPVHVSCCSPCWKEHWHRWPCGCDGKGKGVTWVLKGQGRWSSKIIVHYTTPGGITQSTSRLKQEIKAKEFHVAKLAADVQSEPGALVTSQRPLSRRQPQTPEAHGSLPSPVWLVASEQPLLEDKDRLVFFLTLFGPLIGCLTKPIEWISSGLG